MKRKLLITSVALIALVAAGIAFAAWTVTGTGTGSSTATTARAVTLSPATTGQLYPGATVALVVSVSNTNRYPVHIHQIAANGAITSDDNPGGGQDCNEASVTLVSPPFDTTTSTPIAAGTGGSEPDAASVPGTGNITLPAALTMSNAANDFCQGRTFTIPLTVSNGESAASPHS